MASSVSENIDKFKDKQFKAYMKTAMANACSIVQERARKIAPRETGNLVRSIDFDVSDDGKEGCVFSNVEYAPYVEIGTGIHSSKGNGRKTSWRYQGSKGWVTTNGNKPHPFLEPAMQDSKSEIAEAFEGLF